MSSLASGLLIATLACQTTDVTVAPKSEDAYFKELKEDPTLNAILGELKSFAKEAKAAKISIKEIDRASLERMRSVKTDAAARKAIAEFTDAPDRVMERSKRLMPLMEKFRENHAELLAEKKELIATVLGRVLHYKSNLLVEDRLKSARIGECGGAYNNAYWFATEGCAIDLIQNVLLSLIGSGFHYGIGYAMILISGLGYYYCSDLAIEALGACFDQCDVDY